MIEDIEEDSNKSLADNEIASLMKTLASKNYRENVTFPKKIIKPFKPISFFEAANKNLKKNDLSTSPRFSKEPSRTKHRWKRLNQSLGTTKGKAKGKEEQIGWRAIKSSCSSMFTSSGRKSSIRRF